MAVVMIVQKDQAKEQLHGKGKWQNKLSSPAGGGAEGEGRGGQCID